MKLFNSLISLLVENVANDVLKNVITNKQTCELKYLDDEKLPEGYTVTSSVLTQETVTTDETTGVVTIANSGVASNCTIMTNTSPTLTNVFKVTGID